MMQDKNVTMTFVSEYQIYLSPLGLVSTYGPVGHWCIPAPPRLGGILQFSAVSGGWWWVVGWAVVG